MGGGVSAEEAVYVAAEGGVSVTTAAQVAFVAAGAEVSFSNAADESIHHHPPKSSSPTVVRTFLGEVFRHVLNYNGPLADCPFKHS